MYIYKIAPCLKNYTHDWSSCPFAHKGEKATRRDPLKYSYMASNCPDFKKGSCPRGDSCNFAHGVFESCLHPERYRTQMCNSGANCTRSVCFFAHSMEELRSPYCQDSPSQIDSTTVTALRAILERNLKTDEQLSPSSISPTQESPARSPGNSLNEFGVKFNLQQQGGKTSDNDILEQACNLLCALQLLGDNKEAATAQQHVINILRNSGSGGYQSPQTSLFMKPSVHGFGSPGGVQSDMWARQHVKEARFSTFSNEQHPFLAQEFSSRPFSMVAEPHEYAGIPNYGLGQHPFSYLTS